MIKELLYNWPKTVLAFAAILVLQTVFFCNYMEREVKEVFVLHGDPTWYVIFNYRLFINFIESRFADMLTFCQTSPWGVLLFFQSLICQIVLGPSRLSITIVNLIYFLVCQVFTFIFFIRTTKSKLIAWLSVFILLALNTPFRKDGPGLNIADFHFDLILFFLLLLIHYVYLSSSNFSNKKWAIYLGILLAFTVANRLVSFFLISTLFGGVAFFIFSRYIFAEKELKAKLLPKIKNITACLSIYVALVAVPLLIAKNAIYGHYFRFIFDKEFARERAGLYVMGAKNKLGEAQQVFSRMVDFDFGLIFWISTAITISILIFSIWASSVLTMQLRKREIFSFKIESTFIYFCIWSATSSYLLHVMFPIKSDHLTRMTTAPLFVLFIFLMYLIVKNFVSERLQFKTLLSITGVFLVAAFVNQTRFYFGKGRFYKNKIEMVALTKMYDDILNVVANNNLKEVNISVDRVNSTTSHYCLGAMLSFSTYAFEKKGLMLHQAPQLGGVCDEPISIETAISQLKESDFVLMGEKPDDYNIPFNKSIEKDFNKIKSFVSNNFLFFKEYSLFGEKKKLFIKKSLFTN
jgi:hypothetical protein